MKKLIFIFLWLLPPILVCGEEGNVVLLFQKNEIEVTKRHSLIKKYHFEIQIRNRFAEKYTKIAIPYTKKNKIQNLRAIVKDADGRVVRTLRKDEVVDRSNISDISLYEDNMVKEFVIKHNSYPYTICYSYQQEEKEFLYIDYWIPVIEPDIKTLSAELQLTVPTDYELSISQGNIDAPEVITIDQKKTYRWKSSHTTPIPREIFAPPVRDFLPFVKIIPQRFRYDREGSQKEWKSFGNWECALLKGLNDLPDAEKRRTDAIVGPINDTKEKVRALYHYLQDRTRYINVTIDKGGLKPYPASYVAANKYGDCKALTNYMKTLLETYRIPSYYTNVYAGDKIHRLDRDFPSQQFNHVILFVPLERDTIWLDCTSKGPFNYLGTFSQNREAFVIEQDNSRLIRTPALTAEAVHCLRDITVELHEDASALLTFQNRYRGRMFEMVSQGEKMLSNNDRKQFVRERITGDKNELISFKILKNDRDDTSIQCHCVARAPAFCKIYGNDILLTGIAGHLPSLELPGKRILPVQINYPIHETDKITYRLPEGYVLQSVPDQQAIETRYGRYTVQYNLGEGTLEIVGTLLIHPGYYTTEAYASFFQFIEKIKELYNRSVITLEKENSENRGVSSNPR